MAITNYGTLKTAVADFLQRSDLTSSIPTFIELATARFSDELRTPEMESIYTTTVTSEYSTLPSNIRAVRLLMANDKVVEYVTPFQLQRMAEIKSRPTKPVYTIQNMRLRMYPAQTSLPVALTCYVALTPFVLDADTNWLLTKRPDVYLHAALAQARVFLHDDERLMLAAQFTDKYIAEANRAARVIDDGSAPLTVRAA